MIRLVGAVEGKGIVTTARALSWTKKIAENATKMSKLMSLFN